MATKPEDTGTDFSLDNNAYVPESDAAFSKHLDIAIEAQDGKAPDKNAEVKDGEDTSKDNQQLDKSKDKSSDDGNDKSQSKPDKKGKEEGQRAPSAKDLKLEDGTTVKGGAERRFYEQREVARQEANHYKEQLTARDNELNTLRQQMDTLNQTVQSTHGLAPQELAIGSRIVGDLKKDPVGTVKKLLAELVANGHTIDEIGSGVDTLAIQRMIEERVAPLNAKDDTDSEEEIRSAAVLETQNFFTAHPDARPHDALIGRMLRDNPSIDLNGAYFQLKTAFAERGFDWSRTLEQNVEDSTSSQQQQQQQQPNGKPIPGGGNANPGTVVPQSQTNVAHEDTSFGDIIKAAMRENGLNV